MAGLSSGPREIVGPGSHHRRTVFEETEISKQRAQDENAAIAILNVGAMNDRMKQQAYRVDENMPLLAFDLLAGIITMRIDIAPPFRRSSRFDCR